MKLTEELIKGCGFNLITNPQGKQIWMDSFGLSIYPDQMPGTLYELVRIMTGSAYNKAKVRNGEEKPKRKTYEPAEDYVSRMTSY